MRLQGAAVSIAVAACVFASPATAITGYEVVAVTVPASTTAAKSAVADCPDGKFALGGGTATTRAGLLTSFTPATIWLNAPDGFPVATGWSGAAVTPDTSTVWGLRVEVICGNAVELERITATAPLSSNDTRFTQAICPEDKLVVGGGAHTIGAVSQTALLESVESTAGGFGFEPGWAVSARGPAASTWNVSVIALCAAESAAPLEWVSTSTAISTADDLVHTSDCPDGMLALGGAVRAVPVNNSIATDAARLTSIAPTGDPAAPTGWSATARRPSTDSAEWQLAVGVICVPEASSPLLALTALAALVARRAALSIPSSFRTPSREAK